MAANSQLPYSTMHGVLNILKPPGMTSHDVVATLRRVCKTKRVGHTGTLDPAAAGVLPICIGHATRLVEDLQTGTKAYRAELTFGHETDSCDATGTVVAHGDVSNLTPELIESILPKFRGEIQQTPPLHSAIKVDGKRLYDLAHAGLTEADIPSRTVTISALKLIANCLSGLSAVPTAMLDIECSGGTYIRSLVRDIGRELGCRATMTFLIRTRSGLFDVTKSVTLDEVAAAPESHLWPLSDVLSHCSSAEFIDDTASHKLAQGQKVPASTVSEDASVAGQPAAPILFWNTARTTAIFASLINSNEDSTGSDLLYKPEKVFFLDRMDD